MARGKAIQSEHGPYTVCYSRRDRSLIAFRPCARKDRAGGPVTPFASSSLAPGECPRRADSPRSRVAPQRQRCDGKRAMAQREGSARNDRSRGCRRRGGRPGSTRLVSFLGSNFGCSRESKRGFANPRELYRTKIGSCQRRVNGAFVVECVDLRREAVSLGAVASQKAENQSSARPQNVANLPQARSRITPEIKGVDGKRPVKARRVERNRCAVCFAKLELDPRRSHDGFGEPPCSTSIRRRQFRRRDRCLRRSRGARLCGRGQIRLPAPDRTVRDEAAEGHARSDPTFREP